jgi:hypothetical protein
MAKKTHFTKNYPILKKSIGTAIDILKKDIRESIQYDHFNDRMKLMDISKYNLIRIIYHAAKDAYHSKGEVKDIVIGNDTNTECLKNFLKQALNVSSAGIIDSITINSFGKQKVSLQNEKEIIKELEKINNSKNNLEVLVKDFKLGLTVPKNSDKATDDKRQFVFKSLIQEILLGSIIVQNYRRNPNAENIFYDPNVLAFGTSLMRLSEKDWRGNTSEFKFSNYIHEYDEFKDTSYRLYEEGYKSICYADVSKFFDNISHDLVVDALWMGFNTFNYTDEVLEKAKFRNFVKSLLNVNGRDAGLTIESHFQHLIAKIIIQYMFKDFTSRANAHSYRPAKDFKILFYVDDIIIMGKTEWDADRVLYEVNDILKENGFLLNETKSSPVPAKRTKQRKKTDNSNTFEELKTLVRLPGTHYFDIDELELSAGFGGDSVESYRNTMEQIHKLSHYFNEKGELLAETDIVSFLRALDQTGASGYHSDKFLSQVVKCAMYTARKPYLDLVSKDDADKYIDNLEAKGFETRIFAEKEYPFVMNTYLRNKFKLRDIMFLYKNKDKFIFNEDKIEFYFNAIRNKDDKEILNALQYFYLTKIQNEDMLANLVMEVLRNYPSKIKFLAAIVKRKLAEINDLNYSNTKEEFIDIYNKFMMKQFAVNYETQLKSYLIQPPSARSNDAMFYFTYRMFKNVVNLITIAE